MNAKMLQKLSKEVSYALRHVPQEYGLKVDAGRAWQDGLLFYHGNETIWLADRIPPEYLERKE